MASWARSRSAKAASLAASSLRQTLASATTSVSITTKPETPAPAGARSSSSTSPMPMIATAALSARRISRNVPRSIGAEPGSGGGELAHVYRHRADFPDLVRVLAHRLVARKTRRSGDVQQRLARPGPAFGEGLGGLGLGGHVGVKVRAHHERVDVPQVVHDRRVTLGVVGAEETRFEHRHHLAQPRAALDETARLIAGSE